MEAKQGPIHPCVYRQIRLKTKAGFTIKHITYAWGSEFFSGFWGIYHKYVEYVSRRESEIHDK